MKAILVIDIPNRDGLGNIIGLGKMEIGYLDENKEYVGCDFIDINDLPLKPLPHKDFIDEAESYQTEEEYKAYVSGWNECLDEILRGDDCLDEILRGEE